MRPSQVLAAAGLVAGTEAQKYLGFNSGSTLVDRSAKFKADFAAEFTAAQGLENAPGQFNAVRLYTNIQAYSTDDPIQAFEAAVETKTKILLGVWASGTTDITKELTALRKAVDLYGTSFTDQVIGISIGSEDLYRISVTGLINSPTGVGNSPAAIVGFINDFRTQFANTSLAKIPVGHVDTWDSWTNSSNKPVLDAVDFVGVNEFPYYENGKGNDIKNAGRLFDRAFDAVLGVAGGKPVWLTETGWPASGPNWDLAVPSVANAKYYWNEVGCRRLFGQVPAFWYNLRDSNPDNKMQFAITSNLSTKPLFDLTCPTTFDTPTSTSTAGTSSATGTGSGTGSGSGSGSGSATGTGSGSSSSSTPNAASGTNVFSIATCACVALAGAFFALL